MYIRAEVTDKKVTLFTFSVVYYRSFERRLTMKIGAFCEQFELSPETVRYYINTGLLVPVVKNNRYDFRDIDNEDMTLLLKLKSFKFSIHDIHKILSLKRLSNFDSANELNDYTNILKNQKKKILREKKEIQEIIDSLSEEIKSASGKHNAAPAKKRGLPLTFLSYLACPHCRHALSASNCAIEGDEIIYGDLNCSCGFKGSIQNGILICSPGKISVYDWPDKERNCYRLMNPLLVSYMQKAYYWMMEKINRLDTDGKIILEDFVNNYCFCHANLELMNKNALYIITDKYPEIVAVYKNLIEKISQDHKILYIASASNMLPLKNECVNVYIDFDSANEYALFNNGYSTDAIRPYLAKEAHAIGAFFSFQQRSKSIEELHRQFPEAWEKSYDIKYFRRYLRGVWSKIYDECSIANITDVSSDNKTNSYHIPGEVEMDVYFAAGKL